MNIHIPSAGPLSSRAQQPVILSEVARSPLATATPVRLRRT